jgi:hypothetical protein
MHVYLVMAVNHTDDASSWGAHAPNRKLLMHKATKRKPLRLLIHRSAQWSQGLRRRSTDSSVRRHDTTASALSHAFLTTIWSPILLALQSCFSKHWPRRCQRRFPTTRSNYFKHRPERSSAFQVKERGSPSSLSGFALQLVCRLSLKCRSLALSRFRTLGTESCRHSR